MTTDTAEAPPGLRERKRRDKESRILAAATRLFAERGYEAVTTQEIAEAADVGTGTLFRYVGSKSELLVMVMNERLRLGTEAAVARARAGAGPADAILAMLAPLLDENLGHPENTLTYQRETLFGTGPQRDVAAQRVAQLEVAIRTILELHASRSGVGAGIDLGRVAHAVYATVYMDLVQTEVRHEPMTELPARIRTSIDFLVAHLMPA